MEDLLQNLNRNFKNCARADDSVGVPDCEISLVNFPEKVVLDIDCINKCIKPILGKKCDFIIVTISEGEVYMVPIEFKTNILIPGRVEQQIIAGVEFFRKMCEIPFWCYPVLVSNGFKKRSFRNKLKKISIPCNDDLGAKIHWLSCNDEMLDFAEIRKPSDDGKPRSVRVGRW